MVIIMVSICFSQTTRELQRSTVVVCGYRDEVPWRFKCLVNYMMRVVPGVPGRFRVDAASGIDLQIFPLLQINIKVCNYPNKTACYKGTLFITIVSQCS